MSIIEKLSQQICAEIDAECEIAAVLANHEAMFTTGWATSMDNTLIAEFTLDLPYVVKQVKLGLLTAPAHSGEDADEPSQSYDACVSDWEISTDPLTAAREQVTKGIRKIFSRFMFEPDDALTRYQMGRLINVQYQLECRWDINEYGRSRLTVLGGPTFPNTTWTINT